MGFLEYMSDELKSGKFLYSNSELMSYYARGNGLDNTSNDQLYEIVKIVHELTDRHIFLRDLTWKSDIKHRMVEFLFKVGNIDDEVDDFFLDGVYNYLSSEIVKRYGDDYKSTKEIFTDSEGKKSLKILVQRSEGAQHD